MHNASKVTRILLFAVGFTLLYVFGFTDIFSIHISFDSVILHFIGGLVFGCSLAFIIPKISLSQRDLFYLFWFLIFTLQQFANLVEATFFTDTNFVTPFHIGKGLIFTACQALLVIIIFDVGKNSEKFTLLIREYFKNKKPLPFLWKIILSSLSYVPVYIFFGMIVSPFVVPVYRNPVYHLTIPPFSSIISLEILRGFIYTLAFLPLFATLAKEKRTALVIILFLFVPGAFIPLLSNSTLPKEIIPFHMVEILGDSIVYGLIIVKLLRFKQEKVRV